MWYRNFCTSATARRYLPIIQKRDYISSEQIFEKLWAPGFDLNYIYIRMFHRRLTRGKKNLRTNKNLGYTGTRILLILNVRAITFTQTSFRLNFGERLRASLYDDNRGQRGVYVYIILCLIKLSYRKYVSTFFSFDKMSLSLRPFKTQQHLKY